VLTFEVLERFAQRIVDRLAIDGLGVLDASGGDSTIGGGAGIVTPQPNGV
jgi:hypothetical protein